MFESTSKALIGLHIDRDEMRRKVFESDFGDYLGSAQGNSVEKAKEIVSKFFEA